MKIGLPPSEPLSNLDDVAVLNIDSSFLSVHIEIDGKKFDMEINKELFLEQTPDGDFLLPDLEKRIERISAIRASLLAVGEELDAKLSKTRTRFKIWYSKASENAREQIVAERTILKNEKKIPASWFGQITKADIEDYILNEKNGYLEEYLIFDNEIIKLQHDNKFTLGLEKIMEQRSFSLNGIADRKVKLYRDSK